MYHVYLFFLLSMPSRESRIQWVFDTYWINTCGLMCFIYIWSLCLILGTKLLKPLVFPDRISSVINNEPLSITMEFILMRWLLTGSLYSFRTGGWLPHRYRLVFSTPFPHQPPHLQEGEDLRFSSIINNQWFNQSWLCNETPIETLEQWGLGKLPGWCSGPFWTSPYVCLHLVIHLYTL